jgi:transcription elongation GreA/GreB family factor
MNPELSKERILHACIIKQQLTIEDFEKEINQMRTELTSHGESASQDQKPSREKNELLVRMEGELIFLKNELMTLENIDADHVSKKVELGAVVVTDQRVFFISTSIESVEVNGNSVFGLSVHAPIYEAMKGKEKGDRIEFNGLRYQILDIY